MPCLKASAMRSSISIPAAAAVFLAANMKILPSASASECGAHTRITALDLVPLPSGRPAVTAMLGDTQKTLLVDTGGGWTSLTKRTVREMNLPTAKEGRGAELVNVAGQTSQLMAEVPSFAIGQVRQMPAYFYVDPGKDDMDAKTRAEYDGASAPDFLQHFDVDFDFAQKKLNLFSPAHCDGKVVYWDASAVAVIPFRLVNRTHIVFPVQLDGKTLDAELDTGSVGTVLNLNAARRLFGLDTEAPDVKKMGQIEELICRGRVPQALRLAHAGRHRREQPDDRSVA